MMKYKKIKSMDQYNTYCELHENLTFKQDQLYKDELELIEILIDEYESRMIEYPKKMNPVEVIFYLIKENEITKAQLARELAVSRQLITDILNYRRNISKVMIEKLSKRFKMQPIAFSRSYQLKIVKSNNIGQTV